MGFVRCTSLLLLLGVFLSLVANANHVLGETLGMNLELRDETAFAATSRRSRLLRGRKMSAVVNVEKDHEVMEVKGSMTNTGKKPEDSSSNYKMHEKDTRNTKLKSKPSTRAGFQTYVSSSASVSTNLSTSHGSQDPSETTIKPHKHVDEATDMFNMMSRDYHAKARRRPPINNKVPLQEFNDDNNNDDEP